MKTIGLIGGMSWESTVTYYQVINVYAMTEEDDNSWRLYGNRIQEIGQ